MRKAEIVTRGGKHVRRVPEAEALGLLRRGGWVLVRKRPLAIRPMGDAELRRSDPTGITPDDMRAAVGESRPAWCTDADDPAARRARARIAGWADGRAGA